VAPQLPVLVEVAPLREEVDVEVGEDQAEGVRIVLGPAVPVVGDELQAVREDLPVPGNCASKTPSGWTRVIAVRVSPPAASRRT